MTSFMPITATNTFYANSTSDAGGASNANGTATASQELDRNAFLNLLITELQHQDPTKPMEDREFIAQLAQFSALEQMQQVSGKLDMMAIVAASVVGTNAMSLVGHTITFQGPNDTAATTGTVAAVEFENGQPMLMVGDRKVDPGWVTRVQ